MKTYRVGIWEEQGGFINIKATSKKQAEKLAEDYLNEFGFNGDKEVDVTHRSVELVQEAEVVNEQ